jgi:hypothetical protein
MAEIPLKYIGDGFSKIGIPARDLTAEEVEEFGEEYLLATGLYALPESQSVGQTYLEGRAGPEVIIPKSGKSAKSGKE